MSDDFVRMQYADDGQANFSEWDAQPIGDVGEYGLRIVWTRLGSCRQRVYRFAVSSARRRDMLAAVAVIEGTTG